MRGGTNFRPARDPETGQARHTAEHVYPIMVWQICSDYPGLPDVRTLSLSQIRFFYEGLRPRLIKGTA